MKTSILVFLAAVMLCGCETVRRSPERSLDSYLPGIEEMLQGFAEAESTNKVDFFFVSPVSHDNDLDFAYVYWMTGSSKVTPRLKA